MTIAVNRNFSNYEIARKKVSFRGFKGIRTRGLSIRAAVLYHLSYEDPYTGDAWAFIAQLVKHSAARTQRPRIRIPLKPRKSFFGLFRNYLNCDSLRWSHAHFICIPAVHLISFFVLNGLQVLAWFSKSEPTHSQTLHFLELCILEEKTSC